MLNGLLGSFSTGVAPVTTSYVSIQTATVTSGGTSTITFSSIPSDYTHLQLRILARNTYGAGSDGDYIKVQFNSDTGSNYVEHQLGGNGSSASASAFTSQTATFLQRLAATGLSSSIFGATVTEILEYKNTNKYKTLRTLDGVDYNGGGSIYLTSGLWMSTSAITSITLNAGSGTGFEQYSTFALYGVK